MTTRNVLILVLVLAGVVGAVVYRNAQRSAEDTSPAAVSVAAAPAAATPAPPPPAPGPLPHLVELGSDSCTSCKAMMPVLTELRRTHPTTLKVDFIDVWKHPRTPRCSASA